MSEIDCEGVVGGRGVVTSPSSVLGEISLNRSAGLGLASRELQSKGLSEGDGYY